jgi:hypothetical protein
MGATDILLFDPDNERGTEDSEVVNISKLEELLLTLATLIKKVKLLLVST